MNELSGTLEREFLDKEYAHVYANEFLNAYIATQIKVLREQRGMTQRELARATDMKQARISLLENVNYSSWSIKTLQRLADAFDVTLSVSFEEFSTRLGDMHKFGRAALERKARCEDLGYTSEATQTESQLLVRIVGDANEANKGASDNVQKVSMLLVKRDTDFRLTPPASPRLADVYQLRTKERDLKQDTQTSNAAASAGAPQ